MQLFYFACVTCVTCVSMCFHINETLQIMFYTCFDADRREHVTTIVVDYYCPGSLTHRDNGRTDQERPHEQGCEYVVICG